MEVEGWVFVWGGGVGGGLRRAGVAGRNGAKGVEQQG
jgi:hypothetical protein